MRDGTDHLCPRSATGDGHFGLCSFLCWADLLPLLLPKLPLLASYSYLSSPTSYSHWLCSRCWGTAGSSQISAALQLSALLHQSYISCCTSPVSLYGQNVGCLHQSGYKSSRHTLAHSYSVSWDWSPSPLPSDYLEFCNVEPSGSTTWGLCS